MGSLVAGKDSCGVSLLVVSSREAEDCHVRDFRMRLLFQILSYMLRRCITVKSLSVVLRWIIYFVVFRPISKLRIKEPHGSLVSSLHWLMASWMVRFPCMQRKRWAQAGNTCHALQSLGASCWIKKKMLISLFCGATGKESQRAGSKSLLCWCPWFWTRTGKNKYFTILEY